MVNIVPPVERRPLSVKVTPDAFEAINRFCASQAITVSGLVESMGEFLAQCIKNDDGELLARFVIDGEEMPQLLAMVDRARDIDVERRRRSGSD